jgi:hypothetical protein
VSRFINERRDDFGVELICRTLDVSASAYYQRATGQRSAREIEDERLLGRIRQVHEANYEAYGYRRTWKQLLREGERVPRCQVQRLMRTHGIQSAAAGRGAPRSPAPTRTGVPTWSGATSPPSGPTSSTSRTSPTCAAGRASCSSRS